jgi:hypothetical protein
MISFSLVEFPIMRSHAQAGMISTSEALTQMDRAQGERTVSEFLGRSDVKEQLVKLGVSPEEAGRRLASLSDAEVKKLSTDIDHATAGGDVTGILVVVLLVVLIIYLIKRV